ncbi:hypothetical protein C2E23DRAFT_242652 [Lenzites betulinus]|nr:hypothetical protein C2E23DRAFT_242652 [Lenzites betulinus]
MIGIRNVAFYGLLLHVLAVIITTTGRATTDLVQEPQFQALDDGPEYTLVITPDEETRIVKLLGPEYLEVGLIATKTTGPARRCSVCGKETEFVDWVFTALARGIHSPEFIVEALKLGASPKKLGHDVYCSQCGHLTRFRDATGEEGGAPHITIAPPYNRATRTFAPSTLSKRAGESEAEDLFKGIDEDASGPAPQGGLHGRWNLKSTEEVVPPNGWTGRAIWARKRALKASEEPSGDNDGEVPAPQAWSPGRWISKRAEEHAAGQDGAAEDEATSPPPSASPWRGAWIERGHAESDAEDNAVTAGDTRWPPSAVGWRPLWTRKRDEASPLSAVGWRPLKRGEWRAAEDSLEAGAAPLTTSVWRPIWVSKRDADGVESGAVDNEVDSAPAAPAFVWRPLWSRKQKNGVAASKAFAPPPLL